MVNTVPRNLEDGCGIFKGIAIAFNVITRKTTKTSVKTANSPVYTETGNSRIQVYSVTFPLTT
jgi:hypothetical protein